VAVVGRRREEEAVFEARRHVPDDPGDAGIDGVLRRRRRGRGVRLVEDEEALPRAGPQVLKERVAILGPPERLVGDDEARVRRLPKGGFTAKPRSWRRRAMNARL
jgi:hypothetical protein